MGKRLCGLAILHSHRNMAVNRETDMMPLATVKLEDFFYGQLRHVQILIPLTIT